MNNLGHLSQESARDCIKLMGEIAFHDLKSYNANNIPIVVDMNWETSADIPPDVLDLLGAMYLTAMSFGVFTFNVKMAKKVLGQIDSGFIAKFLVTLIALGENIIQWVIEVIEKAYPRMYKSHVDYVVPRDAQDPDWDSQVEQLFKAK